MIERDAAVIEALGAISRIPLRAWPAPAPRHTMHEGYVSDIRQVEAFCRTDRVFGHRPGYILDRWYVTLYLSTPYLLFYLPAILIAMLQHPKSKLAEAHVLGPIDRDPSMLSPSERDARDVVLASLALEGVTKEILQERIRRGREIAERFKRGEEIV